MAIFAMCSCFYFNLTTYACLPATSLQSSLALCDPMDFRPPGSSVHGILQARILEWVAICFSRVSSQYRDRTWVSCVSCTAGEFFFFFFFYCWAIQEASHLTMRVKVKVTQSCPTLCDPMDYTVHGILQAGILEWVAFPFSRASSQPRDQTQVSCIAGRFFTS